MESSNANMRRRTGPCGNQAEHGDGERAGEDNDAAVKTLTLEDHVIARL